MKNSVKDVCYVVCRAVERIIIRQFFVEENEITGQARCNPQTTNV